jgi:hypothetical protein
MSKSLRERRRETAVASVARLTEKRESIIASLVTIESKLRFLRRQVARYDKAEARPVPRAAPDIKTEAPKLERTADDLGIPTFLQRQKDAEARDKAAADAIRAEQDERKRNKTRVRIEEMKAKQSGVTKRMPLQGREALKAIYE